MTQEEMLEAGNYILSKYYTEPFKYSIEGVLPCGAKYNMTDPYTIHIQPVKSIEFVELKITINKTDSEVWQNQS